MSIKRIAEHSPLCGGGWPSPQRGSGEECALSGIVASLSRPASRATLSRRGERDFPAALLIAALVLATPALADDKADCTAGIAMIQTEIAKAPAEPVLAKLRKALKVAEREQKEGEFDECLDAVGDARRAVK